MLLYRALRWVNSVYPLAMFFSYLAIAIATFAVCFLIPVVGVLSLIFSIFALLPAVLLWKLLQAGERWLARGSIRRHVCPECGEGITHPGAVDCTACGAAFDDHGARVAVR
ncbi:hypothetical protein OAL71_00310 [Phycisphaerales bacterium]|nr:hypothetical protein [Phycisphaerales bacterium]